MSTAPIAQVAAASTGVELTPAGVERLREHMEPVEAPGEDALAGLSPDEAELLARVLGEVAAPRTVPS